MHLISPGCPRPSIALQKPACGKYAPVHCNLNAFSSAQNVPKVELFALIFQTLSEIMY